MRVALYYPWVYLRSGAERMMLEMVTRSRHEWVIYTNHYLPEQTFPEYRDLPLVELARVPVSRRYAAVSNAALTILRQKIDLSGFDALMVSSEGLGDFITFRNHSVPVICYCHTPLKVIHDRAMRQRYLETHGRLTKLAFLFFSIAFRFFDKLAWRHYSYTFCNSQEVRQRVLEARLAPPENVEVLHPGLDTQLMSPSGIYEKYFVVIGRIKWWKNIELAIDSFLEFRERFPRHKDFYLRIVGLVESGSEEYLQRLRDLAAGDDHILFQRDPDGEQLLEAYRSAYALLFPSLNEDWGMVPLEAMGFGKPVISVNRGGPAESVIDGETGFLVPPDATAFAAAMARLADDPELTRIMGEAGAVHVRQFDWENFVHRIDEFLDTLV